LTIKDIIEANLKPNAIENINAPKNPDIVLFIWSWSLVLTKGELYAVIVMFELFKWLISIDFIQKIFYWYFIFSLYISLILYIF
jgi:hypothetical protein